MPFDPKSWIATKHLVIVDTTPGMAHIAGWVIVDRGIRHGLSHAYRLARENFGPDAYASNGELVYPGDPMMTDASIPHATA